MKKLWIGILVILIVAIAFVVIFTQIEREPEEIKIGAILPLTGDVAMYGEIVKDAMELAVEEVNNQGGIEGRNINVIFEDSQAKPELAINSANKLITIDKVAVIIGAMASSEVQSLAPILNKKEVVLISPAATGHEITTAGDYIFRTIVSDIYDGTAMARFAFNEKGVKRVGVFYITEAGPQGVAEAFIAEFEELGGEILAVETIHRGDQDYRSQISKIEVKKPEAIYFALYPRETELFVRQTKELGISELLLTHQLMDDPEVLSKLGEAADGIIFTTPKLTPESGDEVVKDFYGKYKEKFNREPQNFAANAYDAVIIVVRAIEKYGYSSDGIKKGLYEIKDYHGASGVFTMDENGDIEQKMSIMIIRNGRAQPYSDQKQNLK